MGGSQTQLKVREKRVRDGDGRLPDWREIICIVGC